MNFSEDTSTLLRTLLIAGFAAGMIAKVCRECGAEALRQRLYVLDAELFEFARLGHIGTRSPAYAMLRDSIRSMIRYSRRISLTRLLLIRFLGPLAAGRRVEPGRTLESHRSNWRQALGQVECAAVRKDLAELRERLLIEVGAHVAVGAIPLARQVFALVSLVPSFRSFRRLALRNAGLVEVLARSSERLPATA